ncbi:MAG TPA: VWA domain-containing protein, partial [Gemmataceae bacterium]|nr:VWA domain-containing protein [Gemmataceae bacterium]
PAAAAEKGRSVDVVLCLDTSNSMDGLIDSAKRKLWTIVNDLAKIEPAPTLRVALYSYGNDTYDPKVGWVRKDVDLTTDLDEVYKQLVALTTKGGTEYVARVTRDALAQLKWAEDKDSLRLIFVCGNEPADQDKDVTLQSVAAEAKAKGVLINTIYCGPPSHPETVGWKEFAGIAGGKYANIDQDRAGTQVVKTPFDEELTKLGAEINKTYCWYGERGAAACANQVEQDKNAEKVSKEVAAERSATKATCLYSNAAADLIDRMKTDKDFDVKKMRAEDLPEEMRKLKPEEREGYLKKKSEERAEIQKKVADLTAKRTKFIEEEHKKEPKSAADKAFDEALKAILKEQAEAKGMKVRN